MPPRTENPLYRFVVFVATCAVTLGGACSCDRAPEVARPSPATQPVFARGIEGVWVIDVEQSLQAMTEVPEGLVREFGSMDEYRAWVRPKIDGAQFEIYPAGKAFMRHRDGSVTRMTWEKQGGKYWVGQRGYLSASIGHIFELKSDREGICKFQMDYSESVAPRSRLIVRKIWE